MFVQEVQLLCVLLWSVCTRAASARRSVCWPSPAGLTESPEDMAHTD